MLSTNSFSTAIGQYVLQILCNLRQTDAFPWSCTIGFFSQHGQFNKSFSLCIQQQRLGLCPRNFAVSSALHACARGLYKIGGSFHSCPGLISRDFLGLDDVETARNVFDKVMEKNAGWKVFSETPRKDVISWNSILSGVSWITLIGGYSKCGDVAAARELFDQLEIKLQPDKMTLVSVISACSQQGDIRFGSWIESYMDKLGIEMDNHLATPFIDLNTKCGAIDEAYEQFHRCGINGKAVDAVKLFEAMVDSQIHTNPATYTGLLTAFNCAGVVEEGYKCFSSVKDHGLFPSSYQYGIMVDLLSRAGRLEEAYKQKKCMPMQSHVEKWGALFPASRLHNNIEYGDIADHHCFMLETDATAYQRWYDAWRLRKHMEENKLVKIPGCSWRELT
ncbi:pentatricopeptide repeat-containing protein [Citrus sinensis]|uniref:Pentatricopeptide repeat-containing protein n=1 Tax=Citrus sinensis TaxID=2711 RepID=A0ACB8LV98_CITSI|nr:pentatricopeptide repeat-containing protein [Citrus sinensis]